MRCRQFVFASSLAFGLAAFPLSSHAETLQCPKHWQDQPSISLLSGDLWTQAGWGVRVPGNDDEDDFVEHYPDAYYELVCHYQNGQGLYIPVPGRKRRCHLQVHIERTGAPQDDYQRKKAWCSYVKTGDSTKDSIQFKEIEPVNRQTLLFGIHLGMTKNEVQAAWTSAGFTQKDAGKEAETSDGYALAIRYDDSDARVKQLTITPPANSGMTPYRPLHARFGEPDGDYGLDGPILNRVCYFWHSGDSSKTRLEFETPSYKDDIVTEIRLVDQQ